MLDSPRLVRIQQTVVSPRASFGSQLSSRATTVSSRASTPSSCRVRVQSPQRIIASVASRVHSPQGMITSVASPRISVREAISSRASPPSRMGCRIQPLPRELIASVSSPQTTSLTQARGLGSPSGKSTPSCSGGLRSPSGRLLIPSLSGRLIPVGSQYGQPQGSTRSPQQFKNNDTAVPQPAALEFDVRKNPLWQSLLQNVSNASSERGATEATESSVFNGEKPSNMPLETGNFLAAASPLTANRELVELEQLGSAISFGVEPNLGDASRTGDRLETVEKTISALCSQMTVLADRLDTTFSGLETLHAKWEHQERLITAALVKFEPLEQSRLAESTSLAKSPAISDGEIQEMMRDFSDMVVSTEERCMRKVSDLDEKVARCLSITQDLQDAFLLRRDSRGLDDQIDVMELQQEHIDESLQIRSQQLPSFRRSSIGLLSDAISTVERPIEHRSSFVGLDASVEVPDFQTEEYNVFAGAPSPTDVLSFQAACIDSYAGMIASNQDLPVKEFSDNADRFDGDYCESADRFDPSVQMELMKFTPFANVASIQNNLVRLPQLH